jgi:CheY-like chemotaxis protein
VASASGTDDAWKRRDFFKEKPPMHGWPPAILLCAKQDILRQAFRNMLRKCGVEDLELSSSSAEAFEEISRGLKRWQVLILDRELAGALETVQKIRDRFGPHLKVVLISSSPTREEVLEAIQAGANDFLTYPVSQATVEEKLRRLGQRKAAEPPRAASQHFPGIRMLN